MRGCRTRLDAPFTVTKLIGFTCIGMSCFHIAYFHNALTIPGIWTLLLGASARESSHSSTRRACRSVMGHAPHFGRMKTRSHDSYPALVSCLVGIFSARYCSTNVLTLGTLGLSCVFASTASRRGLAAFHAAALLGNRPRALHFLLRS